MRLRGAVAVGVAVALLSYVACGFPDFQYETQGGGGTTASGAGGGGHTSSGGGIGGSGAGSSSNGQAGQGGGDCALGDIGACGSGSKCTVVDLGSGQVGCGMAGPKQLWQKCGSDGDCADGSWCDLEWLVCKPFCNNVNDCVFGGGDFTGECVAAAQADHTPLPGSAKTCVPNCDPKTAAPCDTNGSVTCIYVGSGNFDCALSQNLAEGTACGPDSDCAPGLACVGPQGNRYCYAWCSPPGYTGECGIWACNGLNPKISYEGEEYGVCS